MQSLPCFSHAFTVLIDRDILSKYFKWTFVCLCLSSGVSPFFSPLFLVLSVLQYFSFHIVYCGIYIEWFWVFPNPSPRLFCTMGGGQECCSIFTLLHRWERNIMLGSFSTSSTKMFFTWSPVFTLNISSCCYIYFYTYSQHFHFILF